MANLTANVRSKNIPVVQGVLPLDLPVAASERFFNNSLVALSTVGASAGFAKRPALASDVVLGVCNVPEGVDNTSGANGAKRVQFRSGIFGFESGAGGDALAAVDIGSVVYASDDHTVNKTSGSGTRPAAGVLILVEGTKFFVAVGPYGGVAPQQSVGLVPFYLNILTLAAASADVYHVAAPVAGELIYLAVTVNGDVATADATLQGAIDAVSIGASGLLTVPSATYDEGDVISTEPTANNVVARGSDISFTVAGGDTGDASATITGLIQAY